MPQSEYIERARKTFREIVSTYYSNWVNRPIKEEEYNEELCDKCQGNCVIKVGENESECHPDHEAGVCYVREYDSENYAYEMEEMMQNSDIFLLADIEATKDESNALQSSPQAKEETYPAEFIRWLSICIANRVITLGLPTLYRYENKEYTLPELFMYWNDNVKGK